MELNLIFVMVIIALAWIYDFYNGANDCANSIATTVSTRILTPFKAVLLAAVLNFAGALVTSEVAKTIGKGLVAEEFMTPLVIISAICGAVAWAAIATHRGIPVSITHCIIGGVIGAGIASAGLEAITWSKLQKVVIGMITSPIGGFFAAFFLLLLVFQIFKNTHPAKANAILGKSQLLSAGFMAFTHGMNDAQNAMGIITIALLSGGFIPTFEVPLWVMLGSAFFMGVGTLYGGKKVIQTMGLKMVKIKPAQGFAAETASGAVIMLSSFMGIPISTTHVISTAIMGVGSVKGFSAVKWGIVGNIVIAWVMTIPIAAITSALVYWGITLFI
ncbi:MAG: anion permease [Candidatus Altimarinota bacterium]